MKLVHLSDAPDHDQDRFVAAEFLEGTQCNVRVIKLLPGQDLPPHTHAPSDLMLFVAEGDAQLETDDGSVPFPAGSLAYLEGTEILRAGNRGGAPVTLLAFLTPAFPARG